MCGRVVQVSDPLRFAFVDRLDVPDSSAKPPSEVLRHAPSDSTIRLGSLCDMSGPRANVRKALKRYWARHLNVAGNTNC